MKHFASLLLVLFISSTTIAQIELSQTKFDLGEISLLNSDIVDFNITNTARKTVFLLRIDAEKQIGFQYTTKTFKPGNKEGIRIKLNPDRKGRVEQKVKLYFSNNSESIEITIKAIIKALPKNNRTACPQFGSALKPPSGKQQTVAKIQAFDVILFDEDNKPQIAETKPEEVDEPITTEKIEETLAENSTAKRQTRVTTTTRTRRTTTEKPKLSPEERRNSPSLGTILFGKTEESRTTDTVEEIEPETRETKEVVIQVDEEVKVVKVVKETIETPPKAVIKEMVTKTEEVAKIEVNLNLLDESYKPNNIIFLIDASTSMREEQKMAILKTAMVQLLEPLREIDFITIVTYSGEAKVVVPTSAGNLKKEIATQIDELVADGSTNAVKGIKTAIQVGKANFLEDGNNQIFLASDGDFNIGERNLSLRKKIEKTASDGLTITVLGIKNDNWTNKSLSEIAELGKGDLLKIKSMKDASKVLESMKKQASK